MCGATKRQWWGQKVEKKFDDIFIRFDTIPACERQTCDDVNSRAYT